MKNHTFNFSVGDKVLVSNPLASFGLYGVIDQQVIPMQYPKGEFNPKNLLLLPKTRKEYRSTRQISYLVKMDDCIPDLYFWATEMCLRKRE